MISCYDDLLSLHEKKLYLYGTGNVAGELRLFLEENSIDFEGYIVSKFENSRAEIDGKPVKSPAELKKQGDGAAVIAACIPRFRKEIVNSLLDADFLRVFTLSDAFAGRLKAQAECRKLFGKYSSRYRLCVPAHLETGQFMIRGNDPADSFRLRTETSRFRELIRDADGLLSGSDSLRQEFESIWSKFTDVKSLPRSPSTTRIDDFFNIYSIRCHVDKPIPDGAVPFYAQELQAGAAIAPARICSLTDDTGENISERNRDFSEASAIYWAWKNGSGKLYTGCMHYRRHLDLSESDLAAVLENDIDLVNTIPCILYPGIRQFFLQNFLYTRDWLLMTEGIESLHPEYLHTAAFLSEGHYYLANNIMIMKSEWFRRMCSFVFDILLYIDDYYKAHGFVRQDRYAGYIFEVLYSVFVLHHAKEMKMAFTDMNARVFC